MLDRINALFRRPGQVATAEQKRRLERLARELGLSKAQAQTLVSRYFAKDYSP